MVPPAKTLPMSNHESVPIAALGSLRSERKPVLSGNIFQTSVKIFSKHRLGSRSSSTRGLRTVDRGQLSGRLDWCPAVYTVTPAARTTCWG